MEKVCTGEDILKQMDKKVNCPECNRETTVEQIIKERKCRECQANDADVRTALRLW